VYPPLVEVEKRKWDGTVSTTESAQLLDVPGDAVAWLVTAGTERRRPSKGDVERVTTDEIWAAVPGQWWVLCGLAGSGRAIAEYVLHAAAPFEAPTPDLVRWIDLDLDFEVHGDVVALYDEAQFHAHARTMSYPDDVVRGAWSGISRIAPRYTTGEWPFDGWMNDHLIP
jgi:protein associated with RNAse G/E